VNTPQILLLSGIGPSQELEKLGIPIVAHSPGVGKNLQVSSGSLCFDALSVMG
jgi:choline dehydrogenase